MNESFERPEKAIIRVQRKDQFSASLRRFKIIVDGKIIGKVWSGDIVDFPVEPGGHEIYVRLDWSRSKKININLNPNEIKTLISGSIHTYIVIPLLICINLISDIFRYYMIGFVLSIIIIILSFIPSTFINIKLKK